MAARENQRKPKIIVSEQDHARLGRLAESIAQRDPDVAEELLAELGRAKIAPSHRIPFSTVQMGSKVEFSMGDEPPRVIDLVFPGEANISLGKISILTPVGVALLGLSTGQSFVWKGRDGVARELVVRSVQQPVSA